MALSMSVAVTGAPALSSASASSGTERAAVGEGNVGASFIETTVTVTEPSSLREPLDTV